MPSSVSLVCSSRQITVAGPSSAATQCQLGGALKSCPNTNVTFHSFSGLRKDGFCVCESDYRAPTKEISKQQSRAFVIRASNDASLPSLNDLSLNSFINSYGKILPSLDPNTAASVFAVLDKNKKVQYIGFSKDLRNSLRILMGRRPELCYFYKMYNLQSMDQQNMMAVRKLWMSELGSAPDGNSDSIQKKAWEQPADAGSISERGKVAAAKAKAKTLQQMLVDRGIKEEMVYDPALLEEGKCDILPAKQSQDDIEEASSSGVTAPIRKAISVKIPSGGSMDFDVTYEMKFKTNGGWMYDIVIIKDDSQTRHRVICGKWFPEAANMAEDDFVETIMGFLLHKKVPRHTEGLLEVDTFPINYFCVSEVAQRFNDLNEWFSTELPDDFWRFNRIHAYGASIDPAPPVGPENTVPVSSM